MHSGCIVQAQAVRSMKQVDSPPGIPKYDKHPSDDMVEVMLMPPGCESNSTTVYRFAITDLRPLEPVSWEQDATCLGCGYILLGPTWEDLLGSSPLP